MDNTVARCAARTAFLFGAAVTIAGCSTGPTARIGMAANTPVAELGQTNFSADEAEIYTLRPSDVVSVTVFREPDLSVQNIPVGADGMLSLPLIGPIKVEGLTTGDLERTVTERLAKSQLIDPRVSVNVMQFGSHLVTVEGSVEKPGMFPFKPGTRLTGAIALAEGLKREGKLSEVAIFRQTKDGIAVAKFDYGAVRAGTMMDPVLLPSDRVIVGTSGLSLFWQDLIKALPAFALFTRF
ncbi:polysaccharide export protein [Novosphingobium sp. ERN07]|uniref:polysaccharide biosynthesis/export family protein n=1 Tax=Novosphingobium sp. ERN07 TaxID=2726187 RepID=UPI001457045C|nr:polysaccharide biosynthesis/export family protein [Novosphingobium sp. ERN07]NLR69405.1 polysaccharide export protein [Novosphingobium sp. ERN07]